MSGYINVTVVGSLGRDPEIRATPSGKKIATFSVAVDQGYGDNKTTEWVNIQCWDKQAEFAEKYLKKGKTIAASGTLRTSSWDDKQTGQKRYKTEVVARDIQFMDTRSSEGGGQQRSNATQPRQQAAPQARAQADPFETEISDDDIPF